MPYQPLEIGTAPDDRTGTNLRAGGTMINNNFAELYSRVAYLLDYKLSSETDYTNALSRAIATGLPVVISYNGGTPYVISARQTLPDNVVILSYGGRANISLATTGRLFLISGVSNVRIIGLIINGNKGSVTAGPPIDFQGASDCVVEDVDCINCSNEIRIFAGSTNVRVKGGLTSNSGLHGVQIDGAATTRNVVTGRTFDSGVGFGVILTGGANKNEVTFNKTYSNGIELIGVTYQCWGNRIIGNHAEGAGDNGISITGYDNLVVGNTCRNNAHNGICLYGSNNVCSGNSCKNNGQRYLTDSSSWAGIMINPGFGGAGYHNTVTGNVCSDDQSSPTQAWGTLCTSASYTLWAAGAASAPYTYYGTKVYAAASSGTNGATPPTHTSGTVSDGGVSWTYLFGLNPPSLNLGAANNSISGNACTGNRVANALDNSGNFNTDFGGTASNFRSIANTPPQGAISGLGGDVLVRKGVNMPYTAIYVNYNGSTAGQSWMPVQIRFNSDHGSRPSLGAGYEGAQFWDTTELRCVFHPGAALGGVWVDALGRKDPVNSITATGTDLSSATSLDYAHARVSTVASGTGVRLPAQTFAGQEMMVRNDGANTLQIYPSSITRAINSLGVGVAYALAAGQTVTFVSFSTSQWFTK